MQKANFSMNVSSSKIEEIKSKVADSLISDEEVKKLINELNLTETEFNENLGWLVSYQEAKKNCAKCKSLNKCQSIFKGMIPTIVREEDGLNQKFVPCELFYKTSNYLIRNFNDRFEKNSLFDDVEIDKINIAKLYKRCLSYLEDINQSGCLVTTKDTTLGTSIIASLTNDLTKKGVKCAYADTRKVIKDAKRLLFNNATIIYEDLIETLSTVPVLVLDRFGEETKSYWSRDEFLTTVFSNRLGKNLLTIIVSLNTIEELHVLYRGIKLKGGYDSNLIQASLFIDLIQNLCPYLERI